MLLIVKIAMLSAMCLGIYLGMSNDPPPPEPEPEVVVEPEPKKRERPENPWALSDKFAPPPNRPIYIKKNGYSETETRSLGDSCARSAGPNDEVEFALETYRRTGRFPDRHSTSTRSEPRVVGRRDPIPSPCLSSRPPLHEKTERADSTDEIVLGVEDEPDPGGAGWWGKSPQSSSPSASRAIRVTGVVRKATRGRAGPPTRGNQGISYYYLETSKGRVPISLEAFQRGGTPIQDLDAVTGKRIRLSGSGYLRNSGGAQQLRLLSVSRIEYSKNRRSESVFANSQLAAGHAVPSLSPRQQL